MSTIKDIEFQEIVDVKMELRKYSIGWTAHMLKEMQKKDPEINRAKVCNIANGVIVDNNWRAKFINASKKVLANLSKEHNKAKAQLQ